MSDLMKYDLQPYDSLHIDKNNVGGVGEVLICILNDTVYCYIVESTEIIRVKYVGNENVEDIVKLIRETYKEKRIDCYMWQRGFISQIFGGEGKGTGQEKSKCYYEKAEHYEKLFEKFTSKKNSGNYFNNDYDFYQCRLESSHTGKGGNGQCYIIFY